MTLDEILDYEYYFEDSDSNSLRQHLFELVMTLWLEGESFSGKRPFGNSGWEYDLMCPLVEMGVIPGEIDEDGYLQDADTKAGYPVITKLIEHIFGIEYEE